MLGFIGLLIFILIYIKIDKLIKIYYMIYIY